MKGRMIKEMMRMNTTEIKLEAKLVGDIQGFFFVPSYQRGYRWGDAEVIRLLDDIYATEGKRNYCLQPVVVRKNGDRFEFDVKRNVIIAMDKGGQYIPFCTRMVFLKYYTPSAENQLHFWGQADRRAYVDAINEVLKDYLAEPLTLEKEDE